MTKHDKNHLTGVLAALLAAGALAAPGFAQDAEPAAAEADETAREQAEGVAERDTVTVVGSRIRGLDLDGAVQAYELDRTDIEESGATSIIDLLGDLTITAGGSGTFSTSTAGPLSSDTPVGAAGVSLRGLGTSATLTLINGRRANVAAFANGQESFIDVNSIPLSAVERVEVLPNGASALYGADAVAGVINYVLRDDYEGQEITFSYGNSTADTDEGRLNVNAVIGRQFGDHNVTAVVDYFKRNAFYERDRSFTEDSLRPSQQGFYPSFFDEFFQEFDQTEEPQDGGCPEDQFGFGPFGEFCEVDVNDFVSISDELESVGGLIVHNWQVNDRLKIFNELLLQSSDSRGTGSPANFSRTPIDPENPNWPAALQEDIVQDGAAEGASDFSDFFGFPIYAWGKLRDPRAVEVESESFRFTTGFEYDFDNSWTVETGLLYGGNDRTQRGLSGLFVTDTFLDANLGNLCSDGSTVRRWDVDLEAFDADFVGDTCEDVGKTTLWYNPFGGQTNQPDGLLDLIETQAERNGESRMYGVDVNATGNLFNFNGRTVKAAIGAEFRREEVTDTPSGVAVATLNNPEPILGFSSTSVDADRDVWAVYGEAYVPLADNLDLQIAGRYDDYEGFGGDFNPKVALRYEASESLIFRANWSTSFRAPSLAQSGAGVLLSSYTVDCEETPQACDGDPTEDGNSLFSEDVGNPDLGAENAESYGAGVLFRPTDNIDVNLDYWHIRHEDLVGIDEDDFIRRALAGEFTVTTPGALPTGEAGLEVRDGFVTDAHFQITNLGYQETSGIDFSYTQYVDDTPVGDLSFLFDFTYLLEYERQASVNSPVEDLAGDFRYPELLANATVRWRLDDWRASLTGRYTSSYKDDPRSDALEALGLPDDAEVDVDSWFVLDANLSYDFAENTFIQLNVRNLLDEEPPLVLGSGSNVDLINHDALGRYVTLRLRYGF
ncbi:MAG: TonB-dependent receptor plug domain-containing protein [Oceanicaulis sp.]